MSWPEILARKMGMGDILDDVDSIVVRDVENDREYAVADKWPDGFSIGEPTVDSEGKAMTVDHPDVQCILFHFAKCKCTGEVNEEDFGYGPVQELEIDVSNVPKSF